MPAHLTTKPQVNGYRFIIRRMEHALVRRDVRMLHEPMRSQSRSLLVGAVLSALVMAGFGIAAWLDPAPDVSDAQVLLAEDSGALYVRVGGAGGGADDGVDGGAGGGAQTLHPALNLASARLVAGTDAGPQRVPDDRLPSTPRGAVVGIPGAPSLLPGPGGQVSGAWTVCDRIERGSAARTTVLVGDTDSGPDNAARPLGSGDAVLVAQGRREYLLYDGARLPVDPADPAVSRALGLGGIAPVRVSAGLIRALPAGPGLRAPEVDGAGGLPDYPIGPARVGDVVLVPRAGTYDRFLVLRDGLQPLPKVVADLAVYDGARAREMGAGDVARAPTTRHPLDMRGYPGGAIDVRAAPGRVLCASWHAGADGAAGTWTVLAGGALPTDLTPSVLVGADDAGPAADAFALRPGAAAHVRALRPGAAAGGGPRFLVEDTGTRYGIPDADTSEILGLGRHADPAPWAVLRLLPDGPALTRGDAMVVHDAIAPDPAPEALLGGG